MSSKPARYPLLAQLTWDEYARRCVSWYRVNGRDPKLIQITSSGIEYVGTGHHNDQMHRAIEADLKKLMEMPKERHAEGKSRDELGRFMKADA